METSSEQGRQRAIAEAEGAQQRALDGLRASHEKQLADLRLAHSQREEERVTALGVEHEASLKAALSKQAQELALCHKNEMEAAIKSAKEETRDECEFTMRERRKSLMEEHMAAENRLRDEVSRLGKTLQDVQQRLLDTDEKRMAAELALKQAHNKITDLESALKDEMQQVKDVRRDTLEELSRSRAKFSTESQAMLAAQRKEYEEMLRVLKEEHTAEANEYVASIEELASRLQQMEERFQAREPRPEDVQRIQQLEGVVKQQEDEMVMMDKQMHYFKLELLNREENFNKVFANKPRVGVMNPMGMEGSGGLSMSGTSGAVGASMGGAVGGRRRGSSDFAIAGATTGARRSSMLPELSSSGGGGLGSVSSIPMGSSTSMMNTSLTSARGRRSSVSTKPARSGSSAVARRSTRRI